MKLLILAAANSIHVVRWVNSFVERGHEVHLASQHAPDPGIVGAVFHHPLPHYRGMGYFINRPRIKNIVDRIRPDVVNAHYATGYGTLSCAVDKVPVVLNVWGSDVFEFPERSKFHRYLLVKALDHAHTIVSTSEVMASRVLDLTGRERKIAVVPFGVDTDRFRPGTGKKEGSLIIGTVKTLAPVYGIDVLIKAFARTLELHPAMDLKLRLIGRGPQENELRRLVDRSGINDRVEFTGPISHDKVPDALHGIDVFCALSRSESFGVAVIEASACGVPVVVSDVGGLPEVVQHEVTGKIVRSEDHEAAAKAIADLVSSSHLRSQMGTAGRSLVMHRFSWNDCVDKMLAVLEEARGHSSE